MAACRADDTLRSLCERGGFKDFNDNKDIKDAREGISCALARRAQGTRDERVMGHMRQIGHMGQKRPSRRA